MHFGWLSPLLALDLIYFPLLALWATWQILRLRRVVTKQFDRITALDRRFTEFQKCFDANLNQQEIPIEQISMRLEGLRNRLEAVEMKPHADGRSLQAIKLLDSGLTTEQLVSACGLSKTEADLLQSLREAIDHKK